MRAAIRRIFSRTLKPGKDHRAGSAGFLLAVGLMMLAGVLFYIMRASALDPPHDATSNPAVACGSCHYASADPAAGDWWKGGYTLGDDTPANRMCWGCHNDTSVYNSHVVTLMHAHSSAKLTEKYGKWYQECKTCHHPHYQRQLRVYKAESYVAAGTLRSITAGANSTVQVSAPVASDFNGYLFIPNTKYYTIAYKITSSTLNASTFTVRGPVQTQYAPSGSTYAIVYGRLVQDKIGGYTVKFFRPSGSKSGADGDTVYDGICEACHTKTQNPTTLAPRFRRTGNADTHAVGKDCTMCHYHEKGFAANIDDCKSCHKRFMGSRRQVLDSNGDGSGTGGDFKKKSHHVYPAAGTAQNTHCKKCHDIAQHGSGTVRLKDADTGAVISYNPANPSTAEAFCLSCHDTNGSAGNMSPFADGKTLGTIPYKMGKDIKTYWDKTYGHRRKGLTCLGNGNPDTGCHSNGHGSDNVGLLTKYLELPMNPATTTAPYTDAHASKYELCFSCHASYPGKTKEAIFGVKRGGKYDWDHMWGANPPYGVASIVTKFRDRRQGGTGKVYDDKDGWGMWGYYLNLHYWHVQDVGWISGVGWRYRDSTAAAYKSRVHCLTCHNVHGSNTQWGWVYDEIVFTHTTAGSDQYGRINIANLNNLGVYPMSCATNCHSIDGRLYMWFEPSGE